jgi:hypothetical protein
MAATNCVFENTSSRRWTMIRKTSLLHKIEPTAMRSSVADMIFLTACAAGNIGEGAPPATIVACNARIDLLFTMSGNTSCARRCRGRSNSVSHERAFFSWQRLLASKSSTSKVFWLASLRPARSFDWQRLRSATVWWSQTGSNRRPPACKAGALPTELWPRTSQSRLACKPPLARQRSSFGQSITFAKTTATAHAAKVVGLGRFELPTSRLSSARSNQLSYKPEPGVSGQKPAIRMNPITEY